jgi:formylglycine-generating enzyme required for sulfatase activity
MAEEPHQPSLVPEQNEDSRLMPLTIAGVICFVFAVIIGYGGWYIFDSRRKPIEKIKPHVTQSAPAMTQAPSQAQTQSKQHQETKTEIFAPPGTVPVSGGQVVLGGESEERPVQRLTIEPFAIAETEVTNEQYMEFVKETGHKPPTTWHKGQFPDGEAEKPVTGVTWKDSADYCEWLSGKIRAKVRLPSEAEWELAAKGTQGYKYPWGNDWKDEAAASKETRGKIQQVKSFPLNKSPFGAYDMAGNVWEWVEDQARDSDGKPKISHGVPLRIIKGGSAEEHMKLISTSSRTEAPASSADHALGFRYIVVREDKKAEEKPQTSQEQNEKKAEEKN